LQSSAVNYLRGGAKIHLEVVVLNKAMVVGLLLVGLLAVYIMDMGIRPVKINDYPLANGGGSDGQTVMGAGDSNAEPIQEDSEFGAGDSCAKIQFFTNGGAKRPPVDEDSEF
jgi:hypothetical protein